MADIGSLVVKIAADASELTKALGEIQSGGDKSAAGMARAGKVMGAAFLAAGAAAVYMTVQAGKAAEELDQLSHITGISTDTLQDYEVAMNRVGLSGSDMQMMFKTLSKNLEEARKGTGEAADRFRQLGIDITKVTNTDDLIRKVMDSMSRFKDGTEKAAIAGALLGKAGLAWIPAMKDGAKALDDAAKKSQEMGELSQDQIAALAAMDDAFDDLAMATKYFAGNLGALLAPAIQFAVELLTNFLSIMNAGLKSMREFLGMTSDVKAGATGAGVAPPPLVDSGKASAATQKALDAKAKALEIEQATTKKLNDATLANYMATQDQMLAYSKSTEVRVLTNKAEMSERFNKIVEENAQVEIFNARQMQEEKLAAYGTDEKSIEQRNAYLEDSLGHIAILENNLIVIQRNAATERTKNATAIGVAIRNEEVAALQEEVDRYQALDTVQQAYYQDALAFEDSVGAARRVRLGLIDAEYDLNKKVIEQKARDEEELAQLMENLDNKTLARRMAVARELPYFWEKQMQAIVDGNAFSMAAIVNTWTSGITTMILKGGDLKAAWESTQQALLQSALNTMVQWIAESVLAFARRLALGEAAAAEETTRYTAMESAKTAAMVAGETARSAIAAASFATMKVMAVGTLASILAVGNAALLIASAVAVAVYTIAMGAAAVMAAVPFGQPAALALSSAAIGMLGASAAAIIAAQGAMQTAAGGAIVALAEGGIVTSPTLAMIGEAGPEAIIPLDGSEGVGGVKQLIVPVYLNRREIARAVVDDLPSAIRKSSVPVFGS